MKLSCNAWMLGLAAATTAAAALGTAHGFVVPSLKQHVLRSGNVAGETSTSLDMGMSRKARRQMQQEQKTKKSRDKKFRDALDGNNDDDDDDDEEEQDARKKQLPDNPAGEEIVRRMEQRPAVSNLYVDEESGMEIIQQGRFVMDVVTRKSVVLYPQPEMRLAQMFPGVPPDAYQKYRMDWKTVEVPDMIDALRAACSVSGEDGAQVIPPFPSITNKALDFVTANRDLLGYNMQKTLGKLMMRAAWQQDTEALRGYRALMRNFLTIENYISGPFRQILMDAELKIGPNFGNLDMESYIGKDLYERSAAYLVLKGMQCTWEKKVRDAEVIENTPQTESNYYRILATGDPRRYHPEPEVIWELKECARVCAMSIEMMKTFVQNPSMFDDLPVELRFLEAALTIKGGAALRTFVADEFCPKEGITPEALREGMRRLLQQLDSMYLDPYADIRNVVDKLQRAMSVGTDDARNPYDPYLNTLGKDSPGYFQTYTFNANPMSLVRFLDAKKFEATKQETPKNENKSENLFGGLFDFGDKPKNQSRQQASPFDDAGEYRVPKGRAAGRPHNLGWLELLDKLDEEDGEEVFGQVPAGQIIVE